MYFLNIWLKTRYERNALDEIVITAELLLLCLALATIFWLWDEARKSMRRYFARREYNRAALRRYALDLAEKNRTHG